jgi:hypothetical protein
LLGLLCYLAKNNNVICVFPGKIIFSHIFLLMHIFETFIENKTRVLVVSTTFVQNFFLRRTERGIIIDEHMYIFKTCYYSQILIKIGYLQQILKK